MPEVFRIALIGPESTGKTTLAHDLAAKYTTLWVPEFSRDYMSGLRRPYTKDDVIHCTKMQMEDEDTKLPDCNRFLFSDTELIIAKVWLLDVFGEFPDWIDERILTRKFDLYLLTAPDLDFVDDPVRENAERRDFFFNWYRKELDSYHFPYDIIHGMGEERMQNAISIIQKHFS